MDPSENVVGGITPQFVSEIQNLARHTSPEENTLVVAALEALSRGAIDPRQVDRVPEHWRGLLYHIQGKAPNECSGMAQRAVHIVEEVISSVRSKQEAMPKEGKRLRAESAEVLPESGLPENILGVMSARARASFAQTSTMGHRVVTAWRVQKMKELQNNSDLCDLLPHFCSTKLDPQHPETCDRMLSELEDFVPDLIKSVEQSPLLTAKKKAALCNHFYPEILQNPTLLKNLLAAAYDLSLFHLTSGFIGKKVPNWNELTFDQKVLAVKEELPKHSQERLFIHYLEKAGEPVWCIPKEICKMEGIETLSCCHQFIRVIPPEFERLKQLVSLNLSANRLSSIPPELGQLTQLELLDLSANSLSSLPPEFEQLKQLLSLDLSANSLSSLPPKLKQLTQLTHLNLRANRLSSLPPELWQLKQLRVLNLSANSLSSIPPELGQLTQLDVLELSGNPLSSLPAELWQLTHLKVLELSGNLLSSPQPVIEQLKRRGTTVRLSLLQPVGPRVVQAWGTQKMQEIQNNPELCDLLPLFCSTKLDSQHPETCDRMLSELADFVPDLIKSVKQSPLLTAEEKAPLCNHFYPEILQNPTLLKNLLAAAYNLSLINLTPSFIKERVPNWEGLTFDQKVLAVKEELPKHSQEGFVISDMEEGTICCIPKEICAMQGVTTFVCRHQFIRVIPPEFGQLTQLRRLYLSHNRLSSLPAELGKLTQLGMLDLSDNSLSSLPPELGKLTQLRMLDLSHNSLSSLPAEFGQLTKLNMVYLSHNSLSSLPAELGNLTQLRTKLDLSHNSLSSLPAEFGNLTQLEELNLSHNRFSSLPAELGNLTQLGALNLCGNSLSSLPPELGQLRQLIVLELWGNPLSLPQPVIEQLTRMGTMVKWEG